MFIFNMYFHKACPKKSVVCNNACFPFCFLPNQRDKDTMGKTNATSQLLNSFTIGKISIIYNTKGPWNIFATITTTTWGYFAIQISSQTTKKNVSEISLLRTIIPRKILSFCDTITFAPVQSQVLRNSRTGYNRKTFPITTASIHCLQLTLHRKLFAANPSPQQFSEPTQKSIGFRYKI
jgi:hypothetical protein